VPSQTNKYRVNYYCLLLPAGIIFVRASYQTCVTTGGFTTSLHFAWNDKEVPEQVISLPLPASRGNLQVTAISVEYFSVKNGLMQKIIKKAFMPAGVVSAMCLVDYCDSYWNRRQLFFTFFSFSTIYQKKMLTSGLLIIFFHTLWDN
jgi:hypothetical protein